LLPATVFLHAKWNINRFLRPHKFKKEQELRKRVTSAPYSFQPFDETHSIFVHIPKCAGISVSQALYGNLAGGHNSLEAYFTVFEPEKILNYFKFTFVRNPWDRLVSAYYFLKAGGMNEEDRLWAEAEIISYPDFDHFVRFWLTEENINKYIHFKPQVSFIQDRRDKVRMDFIGFFENLKDDFKFVAGRLGREADLPKLNTSERNFYTNYYTEETQKIVARVYAKDIELLGYQFGNSTLETQLRKRKEGLGIFSAGRKTVNVSGKFLIKT
jgi:hypothetical protein